MHRGTEWLSESHVVSPYQSQPENLIVLIIRWCSLPFNVTVLYWSDLPGSYNGAGSSDTLKPLKNCKAQPTSPLIELISWRLVHCETGILTDALQYY